MTDHPVAVRQVIWRDLLPWLSMLRVFRIAIAPGPLLLATGALAICSLGWWLCGFLFLTKEEFKDVSRPRLLASPYVMRQDPASLQLPAAVVDTVPAGTNRALFPYADLTKPAQRLFHYRTPGHLVAYYLAGFLISVFVWSFVGGVITRQALVELATEQPYDFFDSIRFVLRRYLQYLMAPLAPLLALVAMGLLVVPLGWLMNLNVGVLLAGLLWIFVIALGLIAAWLIVGLVFGWPLMFGAIGSKRDGDALQAFSDSFSYVYGKPLHYLFYAIIALLLGGLALYVVDLFAEAAKEFAFWAASWGAGWRKIELIREHLDNPILADRAEQAASFRAGVWLIGLVVSLVDTIKVAAAFSYFFASAAAIFLLMRYAVDEKELDEVHLEDEEEHLETARQAMLSAEDAEGIPPAKEVPPPPEATVSFNTAAPPPTPPAVNTTEISTPSDPVAPSIPPTKPPGEEDVAE